MHRVLIALTCLAACSAPTTEPSAPVSTPASVTGRVQSAADNQPIPNALIRTEPFAKQVSANTEGQYVIDDLTPNRGYRIFASADGFDENSVTIDNLAPGAQAVADIRLSPTPAALELSSRTLNIAATDDAATFTISNSGSQALSFRLVTAQSWLTIMPDSGQVTDTPSIVTARVDRTALPGADPRVEGSLEVTSNGGSATVVVNADRCIPNCDGQCAGGPDGCGGTCANNDCNGCCENAICQVGTEPAACGTRGDACAACDAMSICREGMCVERPPPCSVVPATTVARNVEVLGYDIAIGEDGSAFIVWVEVSGIQPRSVWAARYHPDEGWGAPGLLHPALPENTRASDVRVVVDKLGRATALWSHVEELSPTSFESSVRASHYALGLGWLGQTIVDGPWRSDFGRPIMTLAVSDDGVVHAGWNRDPFGPLRTAAFTPGVGWGMPLELTSTTLFFQFHTDASNNAYGLIVQETRIELATYVAGSGWLAMVEMVPGVQAPGPIPHHVGARGDILLLVPVRAGAPLALVRPFGGMWSTPVDLEPNIMAGRQVNGAVSHTGRALAAWVTDASLPRVAFYDPTAGWAPATDAPGSPLEASFDRLGQPKLLVVDPLSQDASITNFDGQTWSTPVALMSETSIGPFRNTSKAGCFGAAWAVSGVGNTANLRVALGE